MKRSLLPALILLLCVSAGLKILSLWEGSYPLRTHLSPESILQAAKLAPLNPDPYYRLGMFHQLEIHHIHLEKSLEFFYQAVDRNPLEQEYWLGLAKVFHRMGEEKALERALQNAIFVFPTGYQGRWAVGNLFLQQGQHEKAIPHFSYILSHYPDQSGLVYEVWGKVNGNADDLLENLVPRDPSAYSQYLSYLYEGGDKRIIQKVWERRASLGYTAKPPEALRYIDFLISQGELTEAYRIFEAAVREKGLSIPPRQTLIVNGGFEVEKSLGGGFDWRIEPIAGAEVSFDREVAFEGNRSLRIRFNGKENLDFHHVFQFVALKPNQRYLLKARVKTNAVTTKSGIKLEIHGIGPAFYGASEPLTGETDWRELSVSFATPSRSQGGVIRFRRERTDKFDRFISGTVWIDNVRIIEESAAEKPPMG